MPFGIKADTIALGDIAFNELIPSAPGAPGVNDFEIDNFTGIFGLPPDFPASDALTFLAAAVVFSTTSGPISVNLGDLAPGSYNPLSLQFVSTLVFTSATFAATLDTTSFQLSDGTTFRLASPQIQTTLQPSNGVSLSPGADFALINATSVPEPESLILLLSGCVVLLGTRRFLARF